MTKQREGITVRLTGDLLKQFELAKQIVNCQESKRVAKYLIAVGIRQLLEQTRTGIDKQKQEVTGVAKD